MMLLVFVAVVGVFTLSAVAVLVSLYLLVTGWIYRLMESNDDPNY